MFHVASMLFHRMLLMDSCGRSVDFTRICNNCGFSMGHHYAGFLLRSWLFVTRSLTCGTSGLEWPEVVELCGFYIRGEGGSLINWPSIKYVQIKYRKCDVGWGNKLLPVSNWASDGNEIGNRSQGKCQLSSGRGEGCLVLLLTNISCVNICWIKY